MSGDYGRFQPLYGMSIVDVQIPALTESNPGVVLARTSTRKICVQKLIFAPSTWAAAVLIFSDSLTGIVIGTITVPSAAPGSSSTDSVENALELDFGPTGTLLSAGANLSLAINPPGPAGTLHIESYQKGPLYATPVYTPPGTAGVTA